MASKKITAMPNLAGGQVSTDLATLVDLSAAVANQNAKSTLNDLISIITKNITDGALRFQGTFNPAVSAANQGALFYNDTSDTFQGSRNTSIYENLLFGNGTNHYVAFFGAVVDRIEGDAGFQYFAAASPNARIVQKAVNQIALQVTSLENVDSTIPLSKWISADGNCRITITPSANQFSTDALNQITVINTSAAGSGRVGSIGIVDTVSSNVPFFSALNNFGSELLWGVPGTTTAGTNTLNIANSCIIKSCCPEGFFIVADDGGRQHMYFVTGGLAFANIFLTLDTQANLVMNSAAIATSAQNGFLYMTSCAGIPTGTPTPANPTAFFNYTGRTPIVFDSTHVKFYAYDGAAWAGLGRSVVSAVAATPRAVLTTESDNIFSNEGAAAQIEFTLPGAAASLAYTWIVQDADGIKITAAGGDTIRFGGTVTGAGGNITSTTIGSTITLVAINATEWMATSVVGTWA